MLGKFKLFVLFFSFFRLFSACTNDVLDPYNNNSSSDDDIDVDYSTITINEALDDNCATHEDSEDYDYNVSDAIAINLNAGSISCASNAVNISENIATITSSGIYKLSGTLSDGQIVVETDDNDPIYLVFDGADITNTTSSPIFIKNAEKTVIVLADGSENYLADKSSYQFEGDEDEPDATLFSKDDLTICGEGSLAITANYGDAIVSKDGLIIKDGKFTIDAADDGIRGKDYLVIHDGNFSINAEGDAIKSTNEDDTSTGYILIESGEFNLTSGNDGIQAQTDLLVEGGNITIKSGGGSNKNISSTLSAKGLKACANIIIDDITTTINSADDAVHCNANITINGGNFQVSSGDDGFHADSLLVVNDAEIDITKCYEGLESSHLVINGGNIYLISSDDGLNVAGGNDSSGGWAGGRSSSSTGYYLSITGGYIVVNATGDGLDANGSIIMTGGTVLINGPTSNGNGALDYDNSFKMNGGYIIAAGSSGMLQTSSSSSSQYSVLIAFASSLSAGTVFHIEDSEGNDVMSFSPSKKYQSIMFSSSDLEKGESYSVYYGGSNSGDETDGLYENGEYTAGTKLGSFTISNKVTTLSVR